MRRTDPVSPVADRVLRRLAGDHRGYVRRVAAGLKEVGHPVSQIRLYRLTWPASKGGTNGLIPAELQAPLLALARAWGRDLSPGDLVDTGERVRVLPPAVAEGAEPFRSSPYLAGEMLAGEMLAGEALADIEAGLALL